MGLGSAVEAPMVIRDGCGSLHGRSGWQRQATFALTTAHKRISNTPIVPVELQRSTRYGNLFQTLAP